MYKIYEDFDLGTTIYEAVYLIQIDIYITHLGIADLGKIYLSVIDKG